MIYHYAVMSNTIIVPNETDSEFLQSKKEEGSRQTVHLKDRCGTLCLFWDLRVTRWSRRMVA